MSKGEEIMSRPNIIAAVLSATSITLARRAEDLKTEAAEAAWRARRQHATGATDSHFWYQTFFKIRDRWLDVDLHLQNVNRVIHEINGYIDR